MKLLNTIRILSGALFISLCCLTASCNFLEIVPVEQADLDDATQDFNSTLGFLHSCYAGIQSPVAFENTEASADEYAVPLEYSLRCCVVMDLVPSATDYFHRPLVKMNIRVVCTMIM